jgi:hypothetical protein
LRASVFFTAMKKLLLACAAALVLATPASAYTAYLMPDDFIPERSGVALQGAYATTFFTPAFALGAEFKVVMPDGSDGYYSQVEVLAQSTALRSPLSDEGTYRFTSGEVLGPVANMVGVDGGWRPLQAGETPPEGAPTMTMQSVSLTDVYVTYGTPNRTAVDHASGRLAITPVTHPNQVLAANGLQVRATFDGAPFANAALVLYRPGEPETDLDRFVTTDANGGATVPLEGAGQYILVARHRAPAPAGAAAQGQTFTTSLVFEAFDTLPAVVDVPDPEPAAGNQRGRRRGDGSCRGLRC